MPLYFFVFVLSIFNWGWLYSESFRFIGVVTIIVGAALSLVLDFGDDRERRQDGCAEGAGVVPGLRL